MALELRTFFIEKIFVSSYASDKDCSDQNRCCMSHVSFLALLEKKRQCT